MNSIVKKSRASVAAMAAAIMLSWSPSQASEAMLVSDGATALSGHWRKTTIVFGSPKDDNMVLYADGIAEVWTVTASSRTGRTEGTWDVDGKLLSLSFGAGDTASAPFTVYQGQLVFPNIPNRRGFWERVE